MKLTKVNEEYGVSVHLKEYDNEIVILFGGTGDLYWSFRRRDLTNNKITVTKENYELYKLFEELYKDIEEINLYEDFEENKDLYRKYDHSNYFELFDNDKKTITWYSDETARVVASYVKIENKDDHFDISFYTQPKKVGYDEDNISDSYITIRFCNSGSRYYPFNSIFMKMYNKLVNIEDSHIYGHQIHMEEYLYEKEKARTKVLKKNQ